MNIAVCIKPVADPNNLKISRGQNMVFEGSARIINPFDEYAIEMGVLLKDRLKDAQTCAICVCKQDDIGLLRKALAKLDRAIAVTTDKAYNLSRYSISMILCHVIRMLDARIIICGSRSPDGAIGQTAVRVATELGYKLYYKAKEPPEIDIPLVMSVDPNGIKPRLCSISDIMKASKKELVVHKLEDLHLEEFLQEMMPVNYCLTNE